MNTTLSAVPGREGSEMPGFVPVDIPHFDATMSDRSMAHPFHVLFILGRYAWRREFPQRKTVWGKSVELTYGQLIYQESHLALEHGYKRETFRSCVDRLEEMGEVSKTKTAEGVFVMTVHKLLWSCKNAANMQEVSTAAEQGFNRCSTTLHAGANLEHA